MVEEEQCKGEIEVKLYGTAIAFITFAYVLGVFTLDQIGAGLSLSPVKNSVFYLMIFLLVFVSTLLPQVIGFSTIKRGIAETMITAFVLSTIYNINPTGTMLTDSYTSLIVTSFSNALVIGGGVSLAILLQPMETQITVTKGTDNADKTEE